MVDISTVVVFVFYFSIILGIGVYTSRYNKSLSDFVLAGRSLGGTVAAMGVGASDMSGWLLLGLPGAAYATGIHVIWMPIGLTVGAYLNWQFIAKRLRVYTEVASDSLTIPSYFEHRFFDESKILRVITALTILVFFTFYMASGFVGGAILFSSTFNIDYHTALWIGATIIITYAALGGFLAVNWTDMFQGTLMFFALMIVPITALNELGGWQPTLALAEKANLNFINVFSRESWISIISLFAWGLGYFGQPHILVRFMATTSPAEIPKARFICMNWMILSLYGAVFTGFIGIAFFHANPLSDAETVFLAFAKVLFNPWVAGFLLAAVLSAIMSTIAAQLLASSSSLTEDFYHTFLRKKAGSRELVFMSRLTVIMIALVAVFIAQNPESSVLHLVSYAWAGLGASFGPVVLLSLFWPRMTRNGAIAGILVGGFTVIAWELLANLGGIFKIYSILPAFILGCIAIIAVSLLDKKPMKKIADQFAEVQLRCQ